MSEITLSICIPTYNRALFLRQCLNSIVSQFDDAGVLVKTEIVISDNASKDGTQEVVSEYGEKFSNIRYYRNSENLGFDNNVLNVVSKASGEYCWLLGDDDALFENSLKTVLAEISTSHCAYYMANCQGYDHELLVPALSHPNLPFVENQSYPSLAEFVKGIKSPRDLVGYFGGMSAQVFKNFFWRNFPQKEQYIGSQTIHMHILLAAMKDLPFMVLAKPLVKTRADNMRWDTFPGLETVKKRREKTLKGLFWISELYNLPVDVQKLNWFFFKQSMEGRMVDFLKKFVFVSPGLKNWGGKIYKKIFNK